MAARPGMANSVHVGRTNSTMHSNIFQSELGSKFKNSKELKNMSVRRTEVSLQNTKKGRAIEREA